MAKKQQDDLEKFIEGLRKNYKVEVNKENFSKISLAPAQPAASEQPGTPQKAPEKAPDKK
jgi:hypothetical protein